MRSGYVALLLSVVTHRQRGAFPRVGPWTKSCLSPDRVNTGSNPIGVVAQRLRESGRSRPTPWRRQCASTGPSPTARRMRQIGPFAAVLGRSRYGGSAPGPTVPGASSERARSTRLPPRLIHVSPMVRFSGSEMPIQVRKGLGGWLASPSHRLIQDNKRAVR